MSPPLWYSAGCPFSFKVRGFGVLRLRQVWEAAVVTRAAGRHGLCKVFAIARFLRVPRLLLDPGSDRLGIAALGEHR